MIAKRFGTATAVALLALFGASCAHHSTGSSSGRSASAAGMASTTASSGASGAAQMGRGRCEALQGAEREKCLAEERR
jgi:hypothetical protein